MPSGPQQVNAVVADLAGNRAYTTNAFTLVVVTNALFAHSPAGAVTGILYQTSGGMESALSLVRDGQYRVTSLSTNGVLSERFDYDATGRRAYQVSDGQTNWLVYAGPQVIAETDGNGTLLKSYLWGPGIDNLLAYTRHEGTNATTYTALTDHLGSVLAMVNENGTVVESYRYDAWGRVLGVQDENGVEIGKTAIGNCYLFQGAWYSWSTGLYNFRARWYDPVSGRWLSKDPIGIAGGLNMYEAFGSNPVNFRDPSGLFLEHLDLYGSMEEMATLGVQRGGFAGAVQGNFYAGMTALLDTVGGSAVDGTAKRSGTAFGEGRPVAGTAWGVTSGGLIAVNALSFGCMGQMVGGTAGKAGVREFSHSIPNRLSGPRAWYNGAMVSPRHHALMDPYRHLRGMTKADTWPLWRRMINRMPAWAQGVTGLGARASIENAIGYDSSK